MAVSSVMISAVETWLTNIAPAQRDTPTAVINVEGVWRTLTPNQVMNEVRRGTPAGEAFIAKILGINLEKGTR